MIIGCCGSGKSTLARALSSIVNLPIVHLDQCYWQPNWVEMEKKKWTSMVKEIANRPEWIIDGNYGSSLDIRVQKADTVIYLDFPTVSCLWRITKRIWKYHGKVRPDMPVGCKERFDLGFYHYVLTFNMLRRKSLLRKCDAVRGTKKVIFIRSDREAEEFLESLSHNDLS